MYSQVVLSCGTFALFYIRVNMCVSKPYFDSVFLQIVMLVLAWKLDALNMGFFTKEEWMKGMTSLQ